MGWPKPLLLVVALGHLLVGMYGLYSPETVARVVSFELLTPGAYGEARAVFGGLLAAFGVAIARGSLGGRGRHWLFAVATAYAGLATGRVFSLALDGLSAHTLFAGLLEVALALFLFWAGMEVGRTQEPATRPAASEPAAVMTAPVAPPPPAPPERALPEPQPATEPEPVAEPEPTPEPAAAERETGEKR